MEGAGRWGYDDFSTAIEPAAVYETLSMYVDLGIVEPEPAPEPETLVWQAGS